jgi:hypothetical protein
LQRRRRIATTELLVELDLVLAGVGLAQRARVGAERPYLEQLPLDAGLDRILCGLERCGTIISALWR